MGDVKAALSHFRAAYGTLPLSGYLFHIAQSYRRLGQYRRAITLYEGYLRDNPGAPKMGRVRRLVDECRRKWEARRRALNPRLAVSGGSAGTQVPKAPSRPLHRRWWFWTSIAAGVVALAVGLGVGLGTRDDPNGLTLPTTQLGTVDWR